MKHPIIEQLKKYGERQLNADELTQIVLHLDECRACFDSFQTLFPLLSNAAREISPDDLTADDTESFHLDYETHLRPFVNLEIDEVTREIVESHLQNCSFCVSAVAELREFSDGLKQGENKLIVFPASSINKSTSDFPRGFLSTYFNYLSLSAGVILIVAIGGWLIWRQPETTNIVAENQTPDAVTNITRNENSFEKLPDNAQANRKVRENALSNAPFEITSANKKTNEVGNKIVETKLDEDNRLLAALPPDFRAEFQSVLRTQSINLPQFINDIRENDNLRSEPGDEKTVFQSPNGQAIRNSRPVFSWQKFAAQGESYVVTIYDNDFNQIAVSPNLQTNKWQSQVMLKRGEIYKWQVKTGKSSALHSAQFKVLDENAVNRLKVIEKAAQQSPLALGIAYASEGLLSEAEIEFQKVSNNDARRSLARKLKDSLKRNKK